MAGWQAKPKQLLDRTLAVAWSSRSVAPALSLLLVVTIWSSMPKLQIAGFWPGVPSHGIGASLYAHAVSWDVAAATSMCLLLAAILISLGCVISGLQRRSEQYVALAWACPAGIYFFFHELGLTSTVEELLSLADQLGVAAKAHYERADALHFLMLALFAGALCQTVQRVLCSDLNSADRLAALRGAVAWQQRLLVVAALSLVAFVLENRLLWELPASIAPWFQKDEILLLAERNSLGVGVRHATYLLAAYLPARLMLQQVAHRLAPYQAHQPEMEEWLARHGLHQSLKQTVTQVSAIIAPVLASPLATLFLPQ